MIRPSLMLLHSDVVQVKYTEMFPGCARNERTSRSQWKFWSKGLCELQMKLHSNMNKLERK